jgi:hypothetical protein
MIRKAPQTMDNHQRDALTRQATWASLRDQQALIRSMSR